MAEVHLCHRPGTDVALLNGLMHVILDEVCSRPTSLRIAARISTSSGIHSTAYDPMRWRPSPVYPQNAITRSARILGTADSLVAVYGDGITQHTTGTDNVKAVANLLMLTRQPGPAANRLFAPAGPEQRAGGLRHGALRERVPRLPESSRH